MPLQAFSFPFPETRFFRAGSFIYKFKIRGSISFRGDQVRRLNCLSEELEEIIRTVLGNLDSLQPFSSAHFNIYPYKKQWEGASKVTSKHGEGTLRAYPFSLILYLERKMQNEDTKQAEKKMSPEKEVAQNFPSASEPKSKRKRYSPLEDAILKYLLEDLEAESKLSMAGKVPKALTNSGRNQVSSLSEEVRLQVKCILGVSSTWERRWRRWRRRRRRRRKKMQTWCLRNL
ncbi:membrane-anchored junction protein isoform X2 [Centropristis striata]|uniref:membrane-anchored junction protein isoform X2 n=1 Tax=Centropristis striata TaxID=184440 RepID=UPI0027E212D6|nr:membrane-anchored junction protein isoform X2 [Centropristis striata]